MLVRGAVCRLASRTTTHDHPQLARIVLRNVLSHNALSLPAVCAISRAYKAAIGEYRRSYATSASATKPTSTVIKAVKKTAAKKAAPKKVTAKKPKKKTAAKAKPKKKPVKVKRAKKVLTPEEKEKVLIRELKAKALKEPVTLYKVSAFHMYNSENLKGRPSSALAENVKELAEKYRNMTPAEKEHYNHLAAEENIAREKQYTEWVRSHTPDEIRVANLARARLRKLLKEKRKSIPAHTAKITDDRSVKRPGNAYALFFTERHRSGDFKNISIGESGKLIGNEWKALSASEKKKYQDAYAADLEVYQREYEQTFGHKVGQSSPASK